MAWKSHFPLCSPVLEATLKEAMFTKLIAFSSLVALGVSAGSIFDCDLDSLTISGDHSDPSDLNQHWWLHAKCGGVQLNPMLLNNCFANINGALRQEHGCASQNLSRTRLLTSSFSGGFAATCNNCDVDPNFGYIQFNCNCGDGSGGWPRTYNDLGEC